MLVFIASLVQQGRLRLLPVQWWAATAWCQRTGSWTDRILIPQWVLSEVAWWASPTVLQGLPFTTNETEVTPFQDVSSSGWGAQLGSRSTQHLKFLALQRSGDAGRHQRGRSKRVINGERLPASSEVPGWFSWCATWWLWFHQEGGRHMIVHTNADDDTAAQVVRSKGDYVGSRPSARSAQHPGGFRVQSRPDTEYGVEDGHGASTTSVCQVGRAAGRLVCDIRQQTSHQVCIAVSGPQGKVEGAIWPSLSPCTVINPILLTYLLRAKWTDAMSMPWDNGRGLLYAFPPFKTVPQVLQKIAQSPGVRVILIAPLQQAASWFPELTDLSQEDPIPLFVKGQELLTQDVFDGRRGDGHSSLPAVKSTCVETLRAILRAKGHSREAAAMMSRSLRDSSLQVYERGKTTTGSALDGAVFDIAQIMAYLVHNMSRSQLYLGFWPFWLTPFFFRSITFWRAYG